MAVATATTPSPTPKFNIPSDAKWYRVGTTLYAVYEVSGVRISYRANPTRVKVPSTGIQSATAEQFKNLQTVAGGAADELKGMREQWGSFGKFFNHMLDQVMGTSNPARQDAGVLGVIAQYAARPDMTGTELNNLLHATSWYQSHTQAEMEWNDTPEAERAKRRDEVANDLANVWFQYGGVNIDASDPRIGNYIEQVASGKMGMGAFTEMVKTQAAQDPLTPWGQDIAKQAKDRNQPQVDLENTAQRVRDLSHRWGVQLSNDSVMSMAQELVDGTKSDADVLGSLKQQAQVLYAWKDPEMETESAGAPWVETYKRVMEKPADIFNPKVQQALNAGTDLYSFEKDLKSSSGWMETKNARDEMFSMIAEVGRKMGF